MGSPTLLCPDMLTRQARLLTRTSATKLNPESRSFLGGIFGKDGSKPDSKAISTEASFDWNPYKLHQLDEGPATFATLSELKGIEVEVKKKVDEDVKKARSDAEIDVDELFYDMYESNLQGKIRGIAPWDKHEHKKTVQAQNI